MSGSFTTRQSASTIVPRPSRSTFWWSRARSTDTHRKYSTEVFQKGMKPEETLSPLEANVANTLVEYLQGLQNKDWALPGEDGVFDQKFGCMAGRTIRLDSAGCHAR